jgi:pimeloyl-ACP methyl ester carboxylesterase
VLVAAAPLLGRAAAGVAAARFLAEFLSEGRAPWLSGASRPPGRSASPLPGPADLWRPAAGGPRRGLVLVHGLTPDGKDDPRVVAAAGLLARAGLTVLVPDLPALRAGRLRADDAAVVAAALRRLRDDPGVAGDRLAVLGVSVGLAPALAGAAAPDVAGHVALAVSLGGHAEARELVRYFTTGAYGFGGVAGRAALDPALAREFARANLDLVRDPRDRRAVEAALGAGPGPPPPGPLPGPEGRAVLALLANRDPARVDALLDALPAETRALVDALSPARAAVRLRARLLLVHGRGDPAVPFTESLRLRAAAGPGGARLVLVGVLGHVEGAAPGARQAADLVRLWTAAYELLGG